MLTHPTRKLGRRAPKKLPSIKMGEILTGILPRHPVAADWLAKVPQWILGGNDQFGDCGPVSLANNRLLISSQLTDAPQVVSQADIFDLYRRSGNPDFDPDTGAGDNGVDMQTMMEAAHAGGIAGVPVLAFASVDTSSIEELNAAIAIFGGIELGVTLMQAQQSQESVWSYSPGPIWGGHAVLCGRYQADPSNDKGVVSWQEVFGVADDFEEEQIDEIWVPIWPEHLGTRQFEEGIDQDALKAAYLALTGKTLSL